MTEAEIEALAVKHEAFGFGKVDAKGYTTHGFDPDGLAAFARELAEEAVRMEREACAKLVEAHRPALGQDPIGFLAERKVMQVCAAAIRARTTEE